MDAFIFDLRYSFRQLRAKPSFTLVAVLALALGIGAATAIFSVLDTLVIRALPYHDADRIVTVWESDLETGVEMQDVGPGNFFDWREQATSFEYIAAADPWSLDITGGERPQVLFAARVTEGFFGALGTNAIHGRTFLPEDYGEAGGKVVVLNHGLWERRYGSDPGLIGEAIELDGEPYLVVGVLPPTFRPNLVPSASEREAWIPLIPQGWEENTRGSGWWNVVARLRRGVSHGQAQTEMDAISARLATDYPQTNASIRANLVPLRNHLVGNARTALLILQGAVGFLLLIACANVASLLLARGTERESEFAIRAALGAGRKRLVRQLLTESAVIAAVGCLAGVLLANWGVDLIAALAPVEIARMDEVGVDARVLVFAAGLAGLTVLLFGIVPSAHFSRPDLQASMKEGRTATAGATRQRLRSGLVVAEVALSLVLVIGAGLLARSFVSLLGVDPGFESKNVAVAQVFHYVDGESPEQRRQFFQETLDGIRALPGVQTAGAVSALPFIEANIAIQSTFHVEGRAEERPEDAPNAFVAIATVGYFRTMGIPLRSGRLFRTSDNPDGVPVAVITESLARRYWTGEDPLGQRVRLGGDEDGEVGGIAREIVGIVGQVRHDGLDREARPEIFVPHAQTYAAGASGGMTFVARTSGDAAALIEPMQTEIWAQDPSQAIYRSATLEELVSKSVAARRFNLWLLGSFAGIALLLAAIGIYGLISYSTKSRTHEIGVRIALGADESAVVREVMVRGVALTGIGITIGLAGSLGLTRLLSSLLFEISPTDPVTFVVVTVALGVVATLACLLPALRAARVDPMVALRAE